jgi:hypothetical protein
MKHNSIYGIRYAVCVSPNAFTHPTRCSEKVYKTVAAAIKEEARITAGMPYHRRINYMVLRATFDLEYDYQMSSWG